MTAIVKYQHVHASIKESTVTYGKVKLVLKQNRYFIESKHEDVIKTLLKDSEIKHIVINQDISHVDAASSRPQRSATFVGSATTSSETTEAIPEDIFSYYDKMDQDDENLSGSKKNLFLLEIHKEKIEILQKR